VFKPIRVLGFVDSEPTVRPNREVEEHSRGFGGMEQDTERADGQGTPKPAPADLVPPAGLTLPSNEVSLNIIGHIVLDTL
jgi:hypothetical protein